MMKRVANYCYAEKHGCRGFGPREVESSELYSLAVAALLP